METAHLSEQEVIRREKLGDLLGMGIDPYPAPMYPVNTYATTIKTEFKEDDSSKFAEVCIAGRIMSVRDMGKASFAELQDAHGRIQIYVRKDDLAKEGDTSLYDQVWKKLLDIGDFIGVKRHIQCIVVGDKRPCRRTTRYALQHWCIYFQGALPI